MRFSIWPSSERPWSEILDLVVHCEKTGWDGAYVADHFMPNTTDGRPTDGPMLEGWSMVSALAGLTTSMRLGTLVSGNRYRHPAVVANMAATIDHVSSGRFVLGMGAGWQVNEHEAYGLDLLGVKARLDCFEEACQVITSMLGKERTSFDGEYFHLHDAPCNPKPVQDRLPLLIGGRGERRTMRIAARYADEWNAWCNPEQFRHKAAVLDRHCDDLGRDPATIVRSTQALLYMSDDQAFLDRHRADASGRPLLIGTVAEVAEQVHDYADAGVDELIIPDWTMRSLENRREVFDQFMSEIVSGLGQEGSLTVTKGTDPH